MTHRSARIFCLLCCLLTLCLALASCKGNGAHTHTFADTWESDAANHWHPATCEHTGETADLAAHTFENGVCTVCGRRQSADPDGHTHTFPDTWTADDDYHWHAADCGIAGHIQDKALHTFADGVCTVCGTPKPAGSAGLLYKLSDDRKSYTVIGERDFHDSELVIPATHNGVPVTGIGALAFRDMPGITSLVIGKHIGSIDRTSFRGCSNLTAIRVEEGNTTYRSAGNCLIETETRTLILGCRSSVIPGGGDVRVIAEDAFRYCAGLTELNVPAGVEAIGEFAFSACKELQTVVIPDSVTRIDGSAFAYCTALSEVTIGKSVTEIGMDVFGGCTGMTTATVPAALLPSLSKTPLWELTIRGGETIPLGAFQNCTTLSAVTIGEGIRSIEMSAFLGCSALTSVSLPASLKTIGENAFFRCRALSSVTFADPTGWTVDGSTPDLSDPRANAVLLVETYSDKVWEAR